MAADPVCREPVSGPNSLLTGNSAGNFGYGYAENARLSYAAFKRLRTEGKIPPRTRLLPAVELLPIARVALLREIEAMVATIPPSDLAIQLDVAMEAEHEEYLRRPALRAMR